MSTSTTSSGSYTHDPSYPSGYAQQPHQPQLQQGTMIPHPQQRQSSNYSQHAAQDQFEPFQQPYQQQLQPPQQPPYNRHGSHQSHHSHHSQHSHHSREEGDRELEKRPSFGDTLSLMWGTLVGAITGKRR